MASGYVGMKFLRDIALSCVLIASLLVSGGVVEPAHAVAGSHHDVASVVSDGGQAAGLHATENCETQSPATSTDQAPVPMHCCQSIACSTGFVFEPVLGLSAIRASVLMIIRPSSHSSQDLWKGMPPYQPPRSFV